MIRFTLDRPPRLPADVVAAPDFPAMAARCGIAGSALDLVLAGALTRLEVGRRTCYAWRELLPLVTLYPPTLDVRADLVDWPHTMTVEVLDAGTAHRVGLPRQVGKLVVVERSSGRLGTVRAASQTPGEATAQAASLATTYGARFIPAGGAR